MSSPNPATCAGVKVRTRPRGSRNNVYVVNVLGCTVAKKNLREAAALIRMVIDVKYDIAQGKHFFMYNDTHAVYLEEFVQPHINARHKKNKMQ